MEKQTETVTDIKSNYSGKIVDYFTNILNMKDFVREEEKCNVKNLENFHRVFKVIIVFYQ